MSALAELTTVPYSNVQDLNDEQAATIQELYEHTLEGKWDKVVAIYQNHPWTHTRKITASEDTALHVAVDNDQAQVVVQLVDEIIKNNQPTDVREKHKEIQQSNITEKIEAFEMKNVRGDTPLHLAASKGMAVICLRIAKKNGNLLKIKNHKGETPIFLAALNWRRDAFLCLHNMHNRHGIDFVDTLRRGDGDTILHCAIQREYFDLAVIIVEFYKNELIGRINRKGYSPLQMLATRPAAFKSGSNLRWLKYILYHCIPVDEEEVIRSAKKWSEDSVSKEESSKKLPENYLTCYDFISSLKKLLVVCGCCPTKKKDVDTENPTANSEKGSTCYDFIRAIPGIIGLPLKNEKAPATSEDQLQYFPQTYATCYNFIRAFLGIMGYGLMDLKKMKEKHVWSVRLLNKLMENPSKVYMDGGNQPLSGSSANSLLGIDPLSDKQDSKETEEKEEIHALSVGLLNKLREKSSGASKGGGNQSSGSSSSNGVKLGENLLSEGLLNAIRILRKKVEEDKKDAKNEIVIKETALLIAAKNGILEMVRKILHDLPTTIHDTTSDDKNILLVAVENRQPHIIVELRKNDLWDNLVLGLDNEENTVMHLAAKSSKYKTWRIAGSAMNMLLDIKWYQYVKRFAPKHFFFRDNKEGKDPTEIFREEHEQLIEKSSSWLKDTSESCSVVAALIAGVAFATSSTVPGGNSDRTGKPTLEGQPAFELFAITSLVALCFSVTALIMFLSILTSRKEVEDFRRSLPLKLLLGLSSLFVSISSMLISFCAAHFFVLKDKFKEILFPIYVATCLPITFYAVAQFPLYMDLLKAILTKVPQPRYKEDNL